jgi:hypothetical protein
VMQGFSIHNVRELCQRVGGLSGWSTTAAPIVFPSLLSVMV